MLMPLGDPEDGRQRNEPRPSRIFANKLIKITPPSPSSTAWKTPSSRWSRLRHAAQAGRKKQILYPLGLGGWRRYSIAERLKLLMEQVPHAIKGLAGERITARSFDPAGKTARRPSEYGIPPRYLNRIMSP
jgi:serine protein kinase